MGRDSKIKKVCANVLWYFNERETGNVPQIK